MDQFLGGRPEPSNSSWSQRGVLWGEAFNSVNALFAQQYRNYFMKGDIVLLHYHIVFLFKQPINVDIDWGARIFLMANTADELIGCDRQMETIKLRRKVASGGRRYSNRKQVL